MPGFDAPVLLNVSNCAYAPEETYLIGTHSLEAACAIAQSLRDAGCTVAVRVWHKRGNGFESAGYHEAFV